MLNDAADIVASRQSSGKRPRLYGDYREMLNEKDLDIVLVDTPDHWHALPMIEAVKSGADVYVQKPTGVDVIESQAMLNAARKYGRVVQVGTQRRSTPHLIEARELIQEGKLGKIGHVELCCYYHMRNRNNPPNSTAPSHFDYDMWTGPAPMLPYNSLVHPRKWRAFMEYGNGIMGDMCVPDFIIKCFGGHRSSPLLYFQIVNVRSKWLYGGEVSGCEFLKRRSLKREQ